MQYFILSVRIVRAST